MNEYIELARNAIDVARPALDAGGAVVASVTGCAIWDWMKGRFSSGARAEALREVEEHPELGTKWDILEANLADMLSEQADLRAELEKLLGGASAQTVQNATIEGGIRGTIVQVSGDRNDVDVG